MTVEVKTYICVPYATLYVLRIEGVEIPQPKNVEEIILPLKSSETGLTECYECYDLEWFRNNVIEKIRERMGWAMYRTMDTLALYFEAEGEKTGDGVLLKLAFYNLYPAIIDEIIEIAKVIAKKLESIVNDPVLSTISKIGRMYRDARHENRNYVYDVKVLQGKILDNNERITKMKEEILQMVETLPSDERMKILDRLIETLTSPPST